MAHGTLWTSYSGRTEIRGENGADSGQRTAEKGVTHTVHSCVPDFPCFDTLRKSTFRKLMNENLRI